MTVKSLAIFYITLSIVCSQSFNYASQAQSSKLDKKGARAFVQDFYNWYTAIYNAENIGKSNSTPAEIIALNKKATSFDPSLRKAILGDYNAQKKVAGEIVGLDADPFLSAQDTGFSYLVGTIQSSQNSYFVDIHTGLAGKSRQSILSGDIVVIAQVVKVKSHWIFKNFFYPSKQGKLSLLQILKDLQVNRVKNGYENAR